MYKHSTTVIIQACLIPSTSSSGNYDDTRNFCLETIEAFIISDFGTLCDLVPNTRDGRILFLFLYGIAVFFGIFEIPISYLYLGILQYKYLYLYLIANPRTSEACSENASTNPSFNGEFVQPSLEAKNDGPASHPLNPLRVIIGGPSQFSCIN